MARVSTGVRQALARIDWYKEVDLRLWGRFHINTRRALMRHKFVERNVCGMIQLTAAGREALGC